MRPRLRPIFVALGLVPACQPGQGETSPFTTLPPETSGASSTGSTETSSGSSTTSSTGSGGGSGSTTELSTSSSSGAVSSAGTTMVYDVGTDVDLGDPKPPGCKGKIDFLFVISRYAGMGYFQGQLLAAFPKFIDTIEAKFADFDYHIMVVDGDPTWGSGMCDAQCPNQCVSNYPCDYPPTSCDITMGSGVVYPAGHDAANEPCQIAGGRRYMTKGQIDLKETFACAAQVGSSGAARMGEALAAAVHPSINEPGGCNEGFLRDDALLMVTLISNTYDEGPPVGSWKGEPGSWIASLLQAKHDDPESIVVFSILDPGDPKCDPSDRTCQMVKFFPYHLLASMLADDYEPFFEQATDLIELACVDFIPPG